MTDHLVFKKAVDMSVFKEGLSIPSTVQERLYAAIGHVVRSGESIPVLLKIENETYPATLKNQVFDHNKYPDRVDIVQIRYATNSEVAEKLRSLFSFTMNLVQRYSSENPNTANHLLIPEGQREYIAVFADDPGTLRLECIPHRNGANINAGVFIPSFKIGDVVSNEQLYKEFGCGNMGGMRPSKINKCLVIISDHTKSLYDDKWYGDELHYTGMGKNGDQTLTRQNKTLSESKTNGVTIHLFEVLEASKYIYHGLVELSSEPYQEEQPDEQGLLRKVWMFPVRALQNTPVAEKSFDAYMAFQQKKASSLSAKELKIKAEERGTKTGANRSIQSTVYIRDAFVAEYTKMRANGVCDLCGHSAPFNDRSGSPYLESHHIIWLANGGEDTIRNTVALCPNCHRKMHIVNSHADQTTLLTKAQEYIEL